MKKKTSKRKASSSSLRTRTSSVLAPHGGRHKSKRSSRGLGRPHMLEGIVQCRSGRVELLCDFGAIQIPRRGLRQAMHGDRVRASVVTSRGKNQAWVQDVLQRNTTSFLAYWKKFDPIGFCCPVDERLQHDFVVNQAKAAEYHELADSCLVQARITSYPSRHELGTCEIERVLGEEEALDLPLELALAKHDIRVEFPETVLTESKQLGEQTLKTSLQNAYKEIEQGERLDLRDQLVLTIDPEDAQDFDDALSIKKDLEGNYLLSVHIADVAQYVPLGSSFDREARLRGCSTYLPGRVIPMLVEELSNNLCSLRPNEERLAVSVFVRLDRNGRILQSACAPSLIRSAKRYCYEEVDEILSQARSTSECEARSDIECEAEGKVEKSRLAPADKAIPQALFQLSELAELRRKQRRLRGGIDFETSEIKVVVDESGKPVGTRLRRRTAATSLVEEAMLIANEVVATTISDLAFEGCFRVHPAPDPNDLAELVETLRELKLLDRGQAAALLNGLPQAFLQLLDKTKELRFGEFVAELLRRAQAKARYEHASAGHFALGLEHYCHFTSPIRRYPDLVMHRILKAACKFGCVHTSLGEAFGRQMSGADRRDKESKKAASAVKSRVPKALRELLAKQFEEVPGSCELSSERERASAKASAEVIRIKLGELWSNHIGEAVCARVLEIDDRGLRCDINDTGVYAFVRLGDLGDEYFEFNEARLELEGRRTGRRIRLGDVLEGKISFVRPETGKIFVSCI